MTLSKDNAIRSGVLQPTLVAVALSLCVCVSCQTAASGRGVSGPSRVMRPIHSGSRTDRAPRVRPAVTSLEPVLLVAGRPGAIRPSLLFHRGLDALAKNRPEQARRLFDRIVALFPWWRSAPVARYNAAVASERLGAFLDAARRYHVYVRTSRSPRDAAIAQLRRGYCLLRARRFSVAVRVLRVLEHQAELVPKERLEAILYQARALLAQKKSKEAQSVLHRGLWLTKVAASSASVRPLAAQAAFLLGRATEIEMNEVTLSPCHRPFGSILFRKGALLDRARRRYYQVLAFGVPVWSSSALNRVGIMIESFYWAVMRGLLPRFSPILFYDGASGRWKHLGIQKQRAVYARYIVRRLRSSVRTALSIYEHRVEAADLAPRWLAAARTRIRTLHKRVRDLQGLHFGAGRICPQEPDSSPRRVTRDPLWPTGCPDRFVPFLVRPPVPYGG
ncbi:MAG: hypothetical protein J7M25_03040 [Deltaproteobacteria bacterium]|nr:hypothetical protein [Deltaproteobacteria bacterium]